MLRSVHPEGMTQVQRDMVECALRILTRASPLPWHDLSHELRRCLEKYMERDVWTGECDLTGIREAALRILRDAITHTGEFAQHGT